MSTVDFGGSLMKVGVDAVMGVAQGSAGCGDGYQPESLHLAAFHPTGTAAACADEQRCPVDQRGRLRGVDGVWVADASILPSCPEVNPQVSITALALAVADEIVAVAG
jgi:choline dehydrogenase-like flavoprotein